MKLEIKLTSWQLKWHRNITTNIESHNDILVQIVYGQSFSTVQGFLSSSSVFLSNFMNQTQAIRTVFVFRIWKDYAKTNEVHNNIFLKFASVGCTWCKAACCSIKWVLGTSFLWEDGLDNPRDGNREGWLNLVHELGGSESVAMNFVKLQPNELWNEPKMSWFPSLVLSACIFTIKAGKKIKKLMERAYYIWVEHNDHDVDSFTVESWNIFIILPPSAENNNAMT